jgi:spore photoproduct lyase-like protein
MYTIDPPAVWVHESVLADERYATRVRRVLDALARPVEATTFTDADLPGMIRSHGLFDNRKRMGTLEPVRDPILVFNTFRFDGRMQERLAALHDAVGDEAFEGYPMSAHMDKMLLGHGAFRFNNHDAYLGPGGRRHMVCRAAWRIHAQDGCLHRCHYCALGGLLTVMVNVEDYIAQLDMLIQAHPAQDTYLIDDAADVLCLEPELGFLGPLIEHFGQREDDKYLLIHTKSANVDWMLDLDHRGRTVLVWTLSGATQARELEPRTGTMQQRVRAAAKLQQAGYPVRFKFKPIIPIVGWRRDLREAVRFLFAHVRPDNISLCTLVFLDIDCAKECLTAVPLDPEFVAAAERQAEQHATMDSAQVNWLCRPFPADLRAEVYRVALDEIRRHDADVPVCLTNESDDVWDEMRDVLGVSAGSFVCGCGPNSKPGMKRLTHPADCVAGAGIDEAFARL